MAAELESCPFCGSIPRMSGDSVISWIICDSCGTEGPIDVSETVAAHLWNTRRVEPVMADGEDTKAQPLTMKEIVEYRRAWKAPLLNETQTERSTRYFVLRLFATIDAGLATADAMREGRDMMGNKWAAAREERDAALTEAERLRQERNAQDAAFDGLRRRHVDAEARIEALEAVLRLYAYPGGFEKRPTDAELQSCARELLSLVVEAK